MRVIKTSSGFSAAVGKETFDVETRIALDDGRILSATIDDLVTRIARDCTDEALTQCSDPHPSPVLRHVEMTTLRQ